LEEGIYDTRKDKYKPPQFYDLFMLFVRNIAPINIVEIQKKYNVINIEYHPTVIGI